MMSNSQRPPYGDAGGGKRLPRPGHGHRPIDDGFHGAHDEVVADPHPAWLKKWRSLRAEGVGGGRGSQALRESAHELRNKIAHTPAGTLLGLQAQAELISELAWNDVVAATARQLLAGIRRLQKSGARR